MYVLLVLFPFSFDTTLVNATLLPKQYLLYGGALTLLALTSARIFLDKKISLSLTRIDKAVGILLVAVFASSLFTVYPARSFVGAPDFFSTNVLFFIALVVWFGFAKTFFAHIRLRPVLYILIGVGVLTAVLFLVQKYTSVSLFRNILGDLSGTVDVVQTSFGVWLLAIAVLSLGLALSSETSQAVRWLSVLSGVLVVFALIALGASALLWLLTCGLGALLVIGLVYLKNTDRRVQVCVAALCVLSLACALVGVPKFVSEASQEVVLPQSVSYDIAKSTLTDNVKQALLGTGPGVFGYSFSLYRNAELNSSPSIGELRFNRGSSSLLSFVAEFGVLGLSAALLLVGTIVYATLRSRSGFGDVRPTFEQVLLIATWGSITLAACVVYLGPVAWWLWWTLVAAFSATLARERVPKVIVLSGEQKPRAETLLLYGEIVFLFGIVLAAFVGVGYYGAEKLYARSLRATHYAEAEDDLRRAIQKNKKEIRYYQALAALNMEEAVRVSSMDSPDAQRATNLARSAIAALRDALTHAPESVELWEQLGILYENTAAVFPDAPTRAAEAFEKAISLDPTNPSLHWHLGNSFAMVHKSEDAEHAFRRSIGLKKDFVPGIVSLAALYEEAREIDRAVAVYTEALHAAGESTPILYNAGRLLYNRNKENDRSEAETIWLKLEEKEPNHSNALFSLGLLYEARGDRKKAITYYERVRALNPDNTDVVARLKRLGAALPPAVISQP